MNITKCVVILIFSVGMSSCREGLSSSKESRVIVMTTDLVNDPQIFRLYDSLHSKKGVWPELTKANEVSGIQEIEIYRIGNRLVMMIRVPADADLRKMDSLYVSSSDRVREWGALMSGFQRALPGVDSTQKWIEMKRIHHYLDGQYLQ